MWITRQTSKLVLRVREADEADYDSDVVRMHEHDKPQGIKWGNRMKLSIDGKNWIPCVLEPYSASVRGRIYLTIHARGMLNVDTIGLQLAKLGEPCTFFMKRRLF
ncbi:hypothetical protein ACFLXU_03205 [Chloroflexota bacterium]